MVVYTLEQRWEILRHYFEKFWQKNHLFRWSSFWSWRVCKQAKLSHLEHRNPHAYIKKPTHLKLVTVWCRFWSSGIIGPFFFENEQGEAVIVNGDRYRIMLNKFLFTKIEEKDIGNIWFKQDCATCHTAEWTSSKRTYRLIPNIGDWTRRKHGQMNFYFT